MKYEIIGGVLFIDGKRIVTPGVCDPEAVDVPGEGVVIRIAWEHKDQSTRNVYLYGPDGELKWQISDKAPRPDGTGFHKVIYSFVSVHLTQKFGLMAKDFDGRDYKVDPRTGNLSIAGLGPHSPRS